MGQNLDPEKETTPSYEVSEAVAEAREALDDAREALLGEREHQADLRDAEMEQRQRRADERDRQADARDSRATRREAHDEDLRGAPREQRLADLINAADARDRAAEIRDHAAEDRDAAARMRADQGRRDSRVDRQDRERAGIDRLWAAADRDAAASDRADLVDALVHDLPEALIEAGAPITAVNMATATVAYDHVARLCLDGLASERWVVHKVEELYAQSGFNSDLLSLPLGAVFGLADEWEGGWGRSPQALVMAIRAACRAQIGRA
jgi:hypothetical protein